LTALGISRRTAALKRIFGRRWRIRVPSFFVF
jgi:hypothetical protein